jgi:hypothetical protein
MRLPLSGWFDFPFLASEALNRCVNPVFRSFMLLISPPRVATCCLLARKPKSLVSAMNLPGCIRMMLLALSRSVKS